MHSLNRKRLLVANKPVLSDQDWDQVRELYCANIESITNIAKRFGISQNTIRSRARHQNWVREPKSKRAKSVTESIRSSKARTVNDAAAVGEKLGQLNQDQLVQRAIDQDIEDMNKGLNNARSGLDQVSKLLPDTLDAKELKGLIETNKLCVETIRKIRGLDEKDDSEDEFEGWSLEQLKAEIERISGSTA